MPWLGISAHSSRISRWACHAASVELKDTDEGWQHAVPNHLLPAQTLTQQLPSQPQHYQHGVTDNILGAHSEASHLKFSAWNAPVLGPETARHALPLQPVTIWDAHYATIYCVVCIM